MHQFKKKSIITGILLACAQTASAGTEVFFNPLTQSATVAQTPNHVNELNSPWQVPTGVSYENLTSLHEIEADPSQSIVRVPGLAAGAAMTDMSAFDPATWTPANTLLVGEEWSGQGRLFEVMNPMADVDNGETVIVNELHSIPNVSHEGLRFNHDGSALYFVDKQA